MKNTTNDEIWMHRLWKWADEHNIDNSPLEHEPDVVFDAFHTGIPKDPTSLSLLATFDVGGKNLTELPKEIVHLTRLSTLRLGCNNITELPKEIANLTQLTTLDISHNNITKFPKEITNLTQ